jgi:hypothetical protein
MNTRPISTLHCYFEYIADLEKFKCQVPFAAHHILYLAEGFHSPFFGNLFKKISSIAGKEYRNVLQTEV